MNPSSLAQKLYDLESFQKKYMTLLVDSVRKQFPNLKSIPDNYRSGDIDWPYLLQCASLLAFSEKGECEDAALRIAQHCLSEYKNTTVEMRDAACVILDTLTNQRAIQLATERQYVEDSFEQRLPSPLKMDAMRRSFEYTEFLSNNKPLRLNRFQKKLWEKIESTDWVSVSAPTSTGKSFIICQWICNYLAKNESCTIVYLVPTRALIQQVLEDITGNITAIEGDVNITAFPFQNPNENAKRNILVFTQERLHLFLNGTNHSQKVDVLIVDEAHKVEDESRGILLEQVIDQSVRRNSQIKVLFACPFINNPEILLEQVPPGRQHDVLKSEHTTVNQNIIWIKQKFGNPTAWNLDLHIDENTSVFLGELHLSQRPAPISKLVPLLVTAHGKKGSLVYANAPKDTENMAFVLYGLMESQNIPEDEEISSLISLVKKTIHPDYILATVLKRRIAFHYGNMPQLIRSEIERLFKENKIFCLICTSTLVEGVNLPCRSIFINKPHRGQKNHMAEFDFWNLAGRAGRLGREFQGNIICINPEAWGLLLPKKKKNFEIKPVSQKILYEPSEFIEYCQSTDNKGYTPKFEQLLTFLFTEYCDKGSEESHVWKELVGSQKQILVDTMEKMKTDLSVPLEIIKRNPGINPLSINALLLFFRDYSFSGEDVEKLIPVSPESNDAVAVYRRIFNHINTQLAQVFGSSHKWIHSVAILVVDWMNGYPLSRLIQSQINCQKKKQEKLEDNEGRDTEGINIANIIRDVMKNVEEYARFKVPKFLSCYIDVLKLHLYEVGRSELADKISYADINKWLEFGVSTDTQLSLMSLGLSRTSTVLLTEIIPRTDMNQEEVRRWLQTELPVGIDIPLAVRREIKRVLKDKTND